MNPNVQRAVSAGQSLWIDTIDRRLLREGRLARLVEDGVRGVTTNPTIFDKAVRSGDAYDPDVERLGREGRDAAAIAERLMLDDVAEAAEILRPVFDRTGGLDGFVSLELPPALARDTARSVEEGIRLFRALGRGNVMIKVPGTRPGWAALQRLVAEGVNVNATLLFSTTHYEGVARAYLDGLSARARAGKAVRGVASVASVFVSRIDTAVDKILDARGERALRGKAAVANSKILYARSRSIFGSEAFQTLAGKGARLQRVLWGSTSTKDPSYPELKYVEELVGADTVNTVPLPTLEAFLERGEGKATLEEGLEEARAILERLRALGIDLDDVCERLQVEGIDAFAKSFVGLIAAVEERRGALLART